MTATRLVRCLILLAVSILPACTQTGSPLAKPLNTEARAEWVSDSTPEEKTSTSNLDANFNRAEGWSQATHGQDAEPNYAVVFPQDQVNRIDITINPSNWEAMLADMTALYGEFGSNQQRALGAGRDRPRPEPGNPVREQGEEPNQDSGEVQVPIGAPPGGGDPGWGPKMEGDESNPQWTPVTISFEGSTWTQVGMRFKGNSSLRSTWGSGNFKLPFKLDFDEFEDQYPQIDDQRFYGFKQLSFSSNFHDSSFLREKVAADLFREAGVPAAQTAFYQVFIDHGDGPVYFGLYTAVELVDDTLIKTQFEEDGGNVYKPSGTGAAFVAGTFTEAVFDKETNQDESDYDDILALFQALNAETRTSDPQSWRKGLQAVFDVDGFLNYLAVNTVIQNWDSYGNIAHNYYLYNDPTSDRLTWIPWDNNEAFKGGNMRSAFTLSLDEVTSRWPLIRYLMDDPVYRSIYQDHIEAFINGPFNPDELSARFQGLHELISTSVVGSEGENQGYTHLQNPRAFEAALTELIQHVQERYVEASEYLTSTP